MPRASSSGARRVSVAVVEVGIGGRLDATNVLDPEVSVVTNVAEDHLETLGPSLAGVAREKAGIFRRGQPALTAAAGEGLAILRVEAGRMGARLLEIPPSRAWDDVSPLAGAHQRSNLALAVAAARAFAPLDDATVRRGIAAIRWPGRLQTISFSPGISLRSWSTAPTTRREPPHSPPTSTLPASRGGSTSSSAFSATRPSGRCSRRWPRVHAGSSSSRPPRPARSRRTPSRPASGSRSFPAPPRSRTPWRASRAAGRRPHTRCRVAFVLAGEALALVEPREP